MSQAEFESFVTQLQEAIRLPQFGHNAGHPVFSVTAEPNGVIAVAYDTSHGEGFPSSIVPHQVSQVAYAVRDTLEAAGFSYDEHRLQRPQGKVADNEYTIRFHLKADDPSFALHADAAIAYATALDKLSDQVKYWNSTQLTKLDDRKPGLPAATAHQAVGSDDTTSIIIIVKPGAKNYIAGKDKEITPAAMREILVLTDRLENKGIDPAKIRVSGEYRMDEQLYRVTFPTKEVLKLAETPHIAKTGLASPELHGATLS